MKKLIIILILIISFSNILSAQPNVLKCKKDCGILDSKGEFSFQVRLSMGPDKWGGNITFIEDDIAISQAHVLGINPGKKVCCTPKKLKRQLRTGKDLKIVCMLLKGIVIKVNKKLLVKL